MPALGKRCNITVQEDEEHAVILLALSEDFGACSHGPLTHDVPCTCLQVWTAVVLAIMKP